MFATQRRFPALRVNVHHFCASPPLPLQVAVCSSHPSPWIPPFSPKQSRRGPSAFHMHLRPLPALPPPPCLFFVAPQWTCASPRITSTSIQHETQLQSSRWLAESGGPDHCPSCGAKCCPRLNVSAIDRTKGASHLLRMSLRQASLGSSPTRDSLHTWCDGGGGPPGAPWCPFLWAAIPCPASSSTREHFPSAYVLLDGGLEPGGVRPHDFGQLLLVLVKQEGRLPGAARGGVEVRRRRRCAGAGCWKKRCDRAQGEGEIGAEQRG